MSTRIRADFNGIFGDLLCLSHSEFAKDEKGEDVLLSVGMSVTAFEEDTDELGNPDQLLSNGIVIESPDWLQCLGSRWALQMDDRGVYHESDLNEIRYVNIHGKDHMEERFAGIVCEKSIHARTYVGV